MGVNHNINFGPYIECVCLRKEYNSGRVKSTFDLYPTLSLVEPMSGTQFGRPNADYFVANKSWPSKLARDTVRDYEELVVAIDPNILPAEIEAFQKMFSEEIKILNKHYDSVKVLWGILAYCS